jgi:septum formation protein
MARAQATSSRIVLASGSPRRLSLLQQSGLEVLVHPANVDETVLPGENAGDCAVRLARRKAAAVAPHYPGDFVLGADTVVVSPDGEILGKPRDRQESREMLRRLSGRRHSVLTGVSLTHLSVGVEDNWVCETRVVFKPLDEAVMDLYLESVETLDKAGGYAIQECGELLVAATEGLVSNVIGLPVEEVMERLSRLGAL